MPPWSGYYYYYFYLAEAEHGLLLLTNIPGTSQLIDDMLEANIYSSYQYLNLNVIILSLWLKYLENILILFLELYK